MMLAARGAFLAARRKLTAKSYVQDGLVAMWDGIENAGWGKHSFDIADFKELVSGESCIVASWCGAFRQTELPEYEITNLGIHSKTAGKDIGVGLPGLYRAELNGYRTFEFARTIDSDSPRIQGWNGVLVGGPATSWHAGSIKTYPWSGSYAVQYSGEDVFSAPITGFVSVSVQIGTGSRRVFCVNNVVKKDAANAWWSYSPPSGATNLGFGTSGEKCTLHNVRIYNRALTAEEIAWNYEIDRRRFNLP